jgi:arginine deiminase
MKALLNITSEIDTLKKLLVHSPDNGLGKVVPSKAQDWLFEDIVHLDTIRRSEYDHYIKLLLYFLDPEKIKGRVKEVDDPKLNRTFYQPGHHQFHKSEKVIELQWLLAEVLVDDNLRLQMIASVCALEGCTHATKQVLSTYSAVELASCLLSGMGNDKSILFAPIPNFIFTRDIGIVVKDHLVLNKPAKIARHREALLAQYIFFYHPIFSGLSENIIELHQDRPAFLMPEDHHDSMITLEGGDVMMIAPEHLIIGISERTTASAAVQLTEIVFKKNLVNKVTLLKIPRKRDFMHIDTIFTQVKKDVWVMMGLFSEEMKTQNKGTYIESLILDKPEAAISITQFTKDKPHQPVKFSSLEALLHDISMNDFGCTDAKIIFSGNDEYPYSAREQWTDSCNLLALKEGVVLSYDRNDKTNGAFEHAGFRLVKVQDLIEDLEAGAIAVEDIHDTVILMPSAELSRARGGFHCMSMPLERR